MKFAIDVLHLDRSKKVRKIRSAMKPWRVSISLPSRSVLELPAGTAERTRTQPGDLLSFTRVCAAVGILSFLLNGCAARRITATVAPVTSFDRQIRNAVDAGDGDYQLARLREKVMAAPQDLEFRLQLGAAYESKGYPELALDHYRLACAQHADAAEPQLRLAKAMVAVHRAEVGITGYAEFLARDRDAEPLYLAWLGILQDDAGYWRAGERSHRAAAERALTTGKDRDYLHNNLGYCLMAQGRTAEAQAEFRAALRLNPASEIARDNLGSTLIADPAEAIVHLQSVSDPATAHSNLAALFMEQGKFEEARREVARSLGYDAAFPAALRNLKVLSELDGKPAMISVSQLSPSRRERMRVALRRLFSGPPRDGSATRPTETAQTASRRTELSQ